MAAVAPTVPSAPSARAGRTGRHPWLSVLWTAARTSRGAVGLALASVIVLIAVAGPFVASKSPDALLTLPFAKPSGQFPLGGDFLGRDVLSRVLNGGWALLLMALAATGRTASSCARST
jgi:peptide/nickel transport system permease protein